MTPEACTECGFNSELYDRADTISSQKIIPAVLRAAIEDLPEARFQRRPRADTWSIAECLNHVREAAFGNRSAIEMALRNPGADMGEPPASPVAAEPATIDIEQALARVADEYEQLASLLASLDDDQWQASINLAGTETTVSWFARHVIHDGQHHLDDIGRIRHGFGLGAPTETGVVTQINVSNGGVPKTPVASASVSAAGVAGDVQQDRRHHGRPMQAVCLWSDDVIASLANDGHPIAPGNAGENFSIAGLTWANLRPGARISIGEVPMLISAHAIPCAKNAQWFSDRDFNRMLHATHPGQSRLYAIPLGTGTVTTGDAVVVEP